MASLGNGDLSEISTLFGGPTSPILTAASRALTASSSAPATPEKHESPPKNFADIDDLGFYSPSKATKLPKATDSPSAASSIHMTPPKGFAKKSSSSLFGDELPPLANLSVSRFFPDEEEEEDDDVKEAAPSAPPSSFITPEKFRAARDVITKESPENSLDAGQRKAVATKELQQAVKAIPTPERAPYLAEVYNRTMTRISSGDKLSPASHHQAVYTRLSNSDWMPRCLSEVLKMYRECAHASIRPADLMHPPRIINVAHILQAVNQPGKKGIGFHFCPPGHPWEALLQDRRESPTGTFAAHWQTLPTAPKKFSTFAPPRIGTPGELIHTYVRAIDIAQTCNRVLYRDADDPRVMIEMYHDKGIVQVKTAFFIFANFDLTKAEPEDDFLITLPGKDHAGVSMKTKDLTACAVRALGDFASYKTEYNPVRFVDGDKVIFDIAPQIAANTAVKQGIYIELNKDELRKAFPDLDGIIDDAFAG